MAAPALHSAEFNGTSNLSASTLPSVQVSQHSAVNFIPSPTHLALPAVSTTSHTHVANMRVAYVQSHRAQRDATCKKLPADTAMRKQIPDILLPLPPTHLVITPE